MASMVFFLGIVVFLASFGRGRGEDIESFRDGYSNILDQLREIRGDVKFLKKLLTHDTAYVEATTQPPGGYTDLPATLTMSADNDHLHITLEHNWPIRRSRWIACNFLLPEQSPGVTQDVSNSSIHLRMPYGGALSDMADIRGCSVILYVEIDNHVSHMLSFPVNKLFRSRPSANSSNEEPSSSNQEVRPIDETLRDTIYVFPISVDSGVQQWFQSGNKMNIRVKMDGSLMQKNITGVTWELYYFKDGNLEIFSQNDYQGRNTSRLLSIEEQIAEPFTNAGVITIDTREISEGAILNIRGYYRDRDQDSIADVSTEAALYLNPSTTNEPYPFGALGIDTSEQYSNQLLEIDSYTFVKCFAAGNPTPDIEFVFDDIIVPKSSTNQFNWEYGAMAYALLPEPTQYIVHQGLTCRATNGQATKEHPINLRVRAQLVDDQTGMELISQNEVIITCAVTGLPPPDVNFYRNWREPETMVNETGSNGVTIITRYMGDRMIVKQMTVNIELYQQADQDERGYYRYLGAFLCAEVTGYDIYKYFEIPSY